jgi:hypothetical protein
MAAPQAAVIPSIALQDVNGQPDDEPLSARADHPVVLATPCVGWQPMAAVANTPARVQSPRRHIHAVFGRRLQPANNPQATTRFGQENAFTFGATRGYWTGTIDEFTASGLLNGNPIFNEVAELEKAIDSLTLSNAARLEVRVADHAPYESTAPVNAANVVANPLHADLEFIALPPLSTIKNSSLIVAHYAVLARVVGAIGPSCTQNVRNAGGSQARVVAKNVANGLNKSYGTATNDPDGLSADLIDFLKDHVLPDELRDAMYSDANARAELRDAIKYNESSDGRRQVERARVFNLARAAPMIDRYVLSLSGSTSEAYELLQMLSSNLLPSSMSANDIPLCERLKSLEAAFVGRQAVLAQLAGAPNATVQTIVAGLLKEIHSRSSGSSSQMPPLSNAGGSAGAASTNFGGGRHDALDLVLDTAPFLALTENINKLDLSTEAGIRDAFALAFDPQCVLASRAVLYAEDHVARRHETLGKLRDLAPRLPGYLTDCVAMDKATQARPARLIHFRLDGEAGGKPKVLRMFAQQEYHLMDWYGSRTEPGLLYYLYHLYWSSTDALSPADHYCIPARILELRDFGDKLFTGQGFPPALNGFTPRAVVGVSHPGYTWRTFWDLFLEYLEFARRLETLQQQQQWLDEGHNYAIEALSMMSVSHKANLQALTDLISKRLTCALPYDATPCKAMREKMDGFEEMLEQNHKYRRFEAGRRGGGSGTSPAKYQLPLRSSWHRSGPPGPPGKGGEKGKGAGKPEKGKKRTFAGDDPELEPTKPAAPGSAVGSWKWLKADKELLISGLVWQWPDLCKSAGFDPKKKCGPFLLTKKMNKMACCPLHTDPAHADANAEAHNWKNAFDWNKAQAKYSRVATAEEKAMLSSAGRGGRGKSNKPGGRGRGKGGDQHF